MYGAQIAFRDFNVVDGITGSKWVGFNHFRRFFDSPIFRRVLFNTLGLSLYNLIAAFPFPILLALGLNYVNNRFIKKSVQMITYMPHFISIVVIIGIMMQMMNPTFGVINHVIKSLGMESVNFFGKPEYFKSLYVWSGVWQQAGWGTIIYLSALAGIDTQQHEAAIIDGANKIQRIWYVDIPGILPTVIILLILNVGNIMTLGFEKAFLMQNPLNLQSSELIDTYVYKVGLASQMPNFSYSTAIGLFQSVIGFILIVLVNQISKKISETSLW
jgi:putative aldouronate transport system permease protein